MTNHFPTSFSIYYRKKQWFNSDSSPVYFDIEVAKPSLRWGISQSAKAIERHIPTFHCPDQERVGGFGDGGKWVCQPRVVLRHDQCVVYSFGSRLAFSFENHVSALSLNQCEIHVFDPTPSVVQSMKDSKLPDRIHFHPFGLGEPSKKLIIENETVENVFTLSQIMTQLGHSKLDLLKIDIEGSEWSFWLNTMKNETEFMRNHSFGQIQMEIHLSMGTNSLLIGDPRGVEIFEETMRLFAFFGIELMHSEVNEDLMDCWELAFVDPQFRVKDVSLLEWVQKPYSTALRKERDAESHESLHLFQQSVLNDPNLKSKSWTHLPYLTWLQEATAPCETFWFLSQSHCWCHDPFNNNASSVHLLSLTDADITSPPLLSLPLFDPSHLGDVSQRPTHPLISQTWLNDLIYHIPDIEINVHITDFSNPLDAMNHLQFLLSSHPFNALHFSLPGVDMFNYFIQNFLSIIDLYPNLQLILLDAHFCVNCGARVSSSSAEAFQLWLKYYLVMMRLIPEWRLVWKQCRLNQVKSGTRLQNGHYSFVLVKVAY